jgi:membrane protease YdiL (CAAX protease family)
VEFLVPTRPLGFAAAAHLLVFGVGLPLGAWWTERRISREPLPSKVPYYLSVIIQQLVLAAMSLGVAAAIGLDLFRGPPPSAVHVGGGLLLLAIAIVALAPYGVRRVRRHDRSVYLVAPRSRAERALWVAISLVAGTGEEIAYRAVFFAIAASWVGVPAAVVVSSGAFALAHLAQGWQAAPIVFVFALGFHLLVLAGGSLWVAMAVHVAYDLLAGLAYGWLADRYGYPREPLPPPISDSPARTPS